MATPFTDEWRELKSMFAQAFDARALLIAARNHSPRFASARLVIAGLTVVVTTSLATATLLGTSTGAGSSQRALSATPGASRAAAAPTITPARTSDSRLASPTFSTRLPVNRLHLVSYMPSRAPWVKMWLDYNHDQVDSDFAQIASLGANAVRIVVSPQGIGWPNVTPAGASELRDVVNIAKAHKLAIQFTLFDWFDPFGNVPASLEWMRQAMTPFSGDPSIALVEVKNEVPLENPDVLPWARAMMAALPKILPGVPRTISVGGLQDRTSMQKLADALPPSLMDVVDIHLYGTPAVVEGKLNNALSIADGRTVFVGEMGMATDAASSRATCLDAQSAFFMQTWQLLIEKHVTGFGIWSYVDINPADAPAKYVGTDQVSYGIRTVAGSWKPAAAVVRRMFAQTSPGAYTVDARASSAADGKDFVDDFSCTATTLPSSTTVSGYGGWSVFDAGEVAEAGIAATGGVDGSAAAYLHGTRGDPKVRVPSIVQRFQADGLKSVTVAAEVRLENATGYTAVGVAWFSGSTFLSNSESPTAMATTSGWQELTVASRAPPNATSFQVHLMSYDNPGTVYFDQVRMRCANDVG